MKTEQIIDAAAVVFSSKGFYNTRIQEIADQANIGKGTIYEYYRSKEELFKEVVKTGARRLLQITEQELKKNGSLWDKLHNTMVAQADYIWENRSFANLFMGRESQIISEEDLYGFLYDLRMEIMEALKRAFQEAVDKGEIEAGDISVYAKTFQGGLAEVIVFSILIGDVYPDKEEINNFINVMRFGIEKKDVSNEAI